jgi:hypothetical protein
MKDLIDKYFYLLGYFSQITSILKFNRYGMGNYE